MLLSPFFMPWKNRSPHYSPHALQKRSKPPKRIDPLKTPVPSAKHKKNGQPVKVNPVPGSGCFRQPFKQKPGDVSINPAFQFIFFISISRRLTPPLPLQPQVSAVSCAW
jgi:hypothetical protein